MLKASDAIKSADGFVIVAGVVNPCDVDETVSDLQAAADISPTTLASWLEQIISVLEEIDAGAVAGDGRTVDTTSSVEPAGRRIAGVCRRGHDPVPEVF
jgi:hypothetical protein